MKQFQRLFSSLAFFSCLLPAFSSAQQETQFANVLNNPYLINPAAGGMSDVIQVDLGYRNQWLSVAGSPKTMYASVHSRIRFRQDQTVLSAFNPQGKQIYASPKRSTGKLKHILGGKMINDEIGPFRKTSAFGSYAIHLPFSAKLNMGVGLSVGWSNFQIDPNKVVLHDANDGTYNQFYGNVSTQNVLDVQSGIVFYNDKFMLGISGTQLAKNPVRVNQLETGNDLNRHLFLQAFYSIDVTDHFDVQPFVLFKAVQHAPGSADFGLRFRYARAVWLGMQYRTGNTLIFSAGLNFLRNFNLTYAYEYSGSQVRLSSAGTHEVQLGIVLGRNRDKKSGEENPDKDTELDVE